MPSVVVKILVEVGQHVSRGEALVVLSSMKMETSLAAPHAGTVAAIDCAEGDRVSPGAVLVDIEPDGDELATEGGTPAEHSEK